ncbi:MAG TPA: proline--tRNA ligase, partial [Burkholderiales bacterium]
VELAEAVAPAQPRAAAAQKMQKVPTPGKTTCEDVTDLLKLPLSQSVKALAVMNEDRIFMLLIRGDHQLNEVKATKLPGLHGFRFATDKEIEARIGCRPGYIGPVGLPAAVTVIADRAVAAMSDFVCGANEADHHLTGVNFGRDLPEPAIVADIRNAVAGDASPDGKGRLDICRGIEVGHIFQLRTKYSEAMKAAFLDESGKSQVLEMGCYGIGVSRIVAAAIEQGNDAKGIIWPLPMAPFQVAIAPIGYRKNPQIKEVADRLHDDLQRAGLDVLLDDRDERPGVMFADLELIGVPHRVTVGERGLKEGKVEYQGRTDTSATAIELQNAAAHLQTLCN